MGRTTKYVWDDDAKARLINCQSDKEMTNTFKMYSLSTLKTLRTKFIREIDYQKLPTHLVIPDTQMKPGVPDDHLHWIGKYIVDRQPDVVIHLGDHWDMPSLSSYDRGKKQFEGRRYTEDIKAGNKSFKILTKYIDKYNENKKPADQYKPRLIFLRGNHCYRIELAIESDPVLDGVIGYHHLDTEGWEVHGFREIVWVDGVAYSHYFYNPMTGRPYGGQAISRLKTLGHSFTMGHQQTLDYAIRFVAERSQHAIVAGACYLHDEEYKGPQGNAHWRGIIVKHAVSNGSYNPMFVDLAYLCKRYTGLSLADYIDAKLIKPSAPFEPWGRK